MIYGLASLHAGCCYCVAFASVYIFFFSFVQQPGVHSSSSSILADLLLPPGTNDDDHILNMIFISWRPFLVLYVC